MCRCEQVRVQRHRVPPEQVLEVDVAQRADAHLAVDQVADAGQDPERRGHLAAMLHDVAHHRRRCGRNRDDDLVDVVLPAEVGDLPMAPQHFHPVDPRADLLPVVVDEPDLFHPQGGVLGDLPCDHLPGRPRPDDQDAPLDPVPPPSQPFPSHADEVPGAEDQRHRVHPIQQVDRPRHMGRPPQPPDGRREEDRAQRGTGRDRQHVPDRHVPPPSAELAGREEPERLRDHQDRDRLPHHADHVRRHVEFEPDQPGEVVRRDEDPEGQEEFHRRPAPERDIQERGQPPGDFFAESHEIDNTSHFLENGNNFLGIT